MDLKRFGSLAPEATQKNWNSEMLMLKIFTVRAAETNAETFLKSIWKKYFLEIHLEKKNFPSQELKLLAVEQIEP